MTPLAEIRAPKLRSVDMRPVLQGGRTGVLLRDPLQLSDRTVIVPQRLVPLLMLCDGTRDGGALRAALAVRFGLRISSDTVERLVAALDDALLLEGERFERALDETMAEYRQLPFRKPAGAGSSYPADPTKLGQLLDSYLDAVPDVSPDHADARGLVTPHIDYRRGGPVYARVWKRAAEMVRAAELVVLLGTDHLGGDGQITLTRQHYATPFGVLPMAQEVVDALEGEWRGTTLCQRTASSQRAFYRIGCGVAAPYP